MSNKLIRLAIIIILVCCMRCTIATEIKIAVLDNLRSQKLSSVNYVQEYMNGIDTAVYAAQQRGILLKYEYFPYDRTPLSILNKVAAVKKYAPNFIIGPRSSDKLILLKSSFYDTLVISPLATAQQVYTLPNNFYSMTLPNEYSVAALETYINLHYKKLHHIYVFSSIDCVSCNEIANIFTNNYQKNHPNISIINKKFLSDTVETINVNETLKNYQEGDLIITPNLSYVSAVIIYKSISYLARNNVTFIGGDQWGSAEVSYVGKIESPWHFNALKIIPWSITENSQSARDFRKYYKILYKKEPTALITFITYQSVMTALSVVDSKTLINRDILKHFLAKTRTNKNNFRNNTYSVYRVTQDGDNQVDNITLNARL